MYSNAKKSFIIRFGATNKGRTLDDGYSDQRKYIRWDDGNVSDDEALDDGYTHQRQKSQIKATKALRKAVQNNDPKLVKYILQKEDININTPLNTKGQAALSLAVPYPGMVKLLLQNKAKVDMQDSDEQTALWQSAKMGNNESVNLLMQAGANVDLAAPILVSIQNETPDVLKSLISARADVNNANEDGETALILATVDERTGFMKILMNSGANEDHKTKMGDTVFEFAYEAMAKAKKRLKGAGSSKTNVDMAMVSYTKTQKMPEILTRKIGVYANERFNSRLKDLQQQKLERIRQLLKNKRWHDSRKAVKELEEKRKLKGQSNEIQKSQARDACSMKYFGKQCEGNCWVYAVLGMILKFLQNDTKLYEAHPRLAEYQELLASGDPVFNAHLISRGTRRGLSHDVWNTYRIINSGFKKDRHEKISYQDTTIYGGSSNNLLASVLIHAGYKVTLIGFDYLGWVEVKVRQQHGERMDGKEMVCGERKIRLRKGKIQQTEASTVPEFLLCTNEYLMIRVSVTFARNSKETITDCEGESFFNQYNSFEKTATLLMVIQQHILDIDKQGLLQRLCGALLIYQTHPHHMAPYHAILVGFCNRKAFICNSNDGVCKESLHIDSVLKDMEHQTIFLTYVFSPDHVKYNGKFKPGDSPILVMPYWEEVD